MSNKSFKDLNIWRKSRVLRKSIFEIVKKLPTEEKYRLSDQLIRCSRSVGANIAEGYGRYHFQENIQFCRMSRGSVSEIQDHLVTALDCEYISNEEYDKMTNEYNELGKMLNGYITYLRRQKQETINE